MALTLPPWLDIRPSQFTDAAIAGGQLGQRTAQEAGELAQRGIIAAQEIANRAEQLQVQRESIAAELAGRQAAASQRAAEAQMENSIRQQNFDLEKSAQDEVARRMGERDAAWQEGMSRYERAVNSGDTAAAADAEILQPLRSIAETGSRSTASRPAQSEWSVVNTPSGPGRLNKVTGEFELGEGYAAPAPKTGSTSKSAAETPAQKSQRTILMNEIRDTQREMVKAFDPEEKLGHINRLSTLNRKLKELDGVSAPMPDSAAPPSWMVDPSTIPYGGTPQMFMGDPMPQDPPPQPLRPQAGNSSGLRILSIKKL